MLGAEVLTQDDELEGDEQQAEQDGELAQREGEIQAEHIGDGGDGGGAQIRLGDESHPKGVDEQSNQKYHIALQLFHFRTKTPSKKSFRSQRAEYCYILW